MEESRPAFDPEFSDYISTSLWLFKKFMMGANEDFW